ncbi:hypothetical protein FQV27_12400 [Paracoccus aurantiacus]|uniref:Uncharacterized protein n=1 Tax=Paracoccus aurantiacus TaxID=2599412 RepID=A0A5C6S2D9_9RHOB|nr:hypothetical protein [Paracoccus aurantiacus]TXB68769.1 hypothetical protein FQV27_12400 [Paracoccus aurantiacus]
MSGAESHLNIRSINDFYERWPNLREHPLQLLENDQLPADLRMVLNWMVVVIDRVGPADLDRSSPDDFPNR